jgi:hypothetical protein
VSGDATFLKKKVILKNKKSNFEIKKPHQEAI